MRKNVVSQVDTANTAYVIVLDTVEVQAKKRVLSYRDKTLVCESPLQLLRDKVNIGLLVVAASEETRIETVKEARETLRRVFQDQKMLQMLDELWVEVVHLRGRSTVYMSLSLLASLRKLIEKHDYLSNIIVDPTLTLSDLTYVSVMEGLRIGVETGLLDRLTVKILLLDRVKRDLYRLIEQELQKHTFSQIDSTLLILRLAEQAPEIEPSDKHRVKLLKGKIETLLERLKLGLAFELLSELPELESLYRRTLRELKDQVLRYLLQRLPVTRLLSERRELVDLARRVIDLMLCKDNVALAVLFLRNLVYLYIYSHCCYYRLLEKEQCSVKTLEKYIDKIEPLRYIEDEDFKKLRLLAETIGRTGLTSGLCTGIATEDPSHIGYTLCPGTLDIEDVERTINNVLDKLPSIDTYSLCENIIPNIKSRRDLDTGGAAGI